MDDVLAMAQLADAAELDLFGIGEHHTPEYTVSATATVMAAVAAVTKRIRITSAATLLSTADPVRTFVHELLGNTRYIGQIDVGGQSFAKAAKGIELLATKVAPAVRKAVAAHL